MKNSTKIFISLGSAIVLALIVLLVVRFVVKLSTRRNRRKVEKEIAVIEVQQAQEIEDRPPPPPKTYSSASYQRMAKRLYVAMDGWGTNENEIVRVFGYLKNNTDFIELNKTFGQKDGYNMKQWLVGDLSNYWLDKINKVMASKGIKYRILSK